MALRNLQPAVLCVEPDRAELELLIEQLAAVLPTMEFVRAKNSEEGIKTLEKLVHSQRDIAMVVASYRLGDGTGDHLLLKAYTKWPHALRILLTADGQEPDAAIVAQAKVYRVLHGNDSQEFRFAFQEAARYLEQRQVLDEKSRILGELHRASMSLTGEMHLDKLLHKLMRILLDNAEAENGYIILPDDKENLFIAAEGRGGSYETHLQRIPVNDQSPVSPAIVDSVKKTRDNLVLHDAMNEGMFMNSPYVRKGLLRSVLCAPLVYQGQLFGMLYLDNKQRTNAFSAYSLELFQLLSAPAAIAIQNAQLYEDLENKVLQRTAEVRAQSHEIEKQRDEIAAKNSDIMGSIRYARRIQDAFLPRLNEIREVFPDSFVYYKPKDIVSGDFFWFSQRLSKVIIAAADCTGHGIPGAFMTIMANTLLRQIVEIEGIFKPEEILNQMHLRVRIALQQDEAGTETKGDGLDVAICLIDPKRNKLTYAGANRPLIIVRKKGANEKEIVELKPDKQPVGGEQLEVERRFTAQNVELEKGDALYMFTDGYPDQIGEEINKRFQSRRFQNLLLEYYDKDMDHQRLLLDAELRHWRGDEEQTDDILVLGIRV